MIATLVAAVLCQVQPVPLPENFAHPFYSFKVSMPRKWYRGQNNGKADCSFYAPKTEAYTPRVDLYINKTDIEFGKYVESLKAGLLKNYPDGEVLADDASKVRNRTAHLFTLKFTDGGIVMKTIWMAVGVEGRVYLLGWSCPAPSFDRFAPPIEAMMRSIRIYPLPAASKEQKEQFVRAYGEAEVAYRKEDWAAAAKKFKECAALLPEYPEIHATLGTAYIRLKNYADSEASFEKAMAIDPDDPAHYYNYGSVLLQQGKIDPAITAFQKSTKADPAFEPGWTNLGVAWLRKDELVPAVAALESAVKADPESATAHFNLGSAYERQKKTDLAIAQYKETLKIDDKHALAKEGLARLVK